MESWTEIARERGVVGPVEITAARIQRGWSACDHMIDDRPADRLVGTRHRCVADAVRAATRAEGPWSSALWLTVRDRDGRSWCLDTSPPVPGRRVCRMVEDAAG